MNITKLLKNNDLQYYLIIVYRENLTPQLPQD